MRNKKTITVEREVPAEYVKVINKIGRAIARQSEIVDNLRREYPCCCDDEDGAWMRDTEQYYLAGMKKVYEMLPRLFWVNEALGKTLCTFDLI